MSGGGEYARSGDANHGDAGAVDLDLRQTIRGIFGDAARPDARIANIGTRLGGL